VNDSPTPQPDPSVSAPSRLRTLKITYEVDGQVIRVVEKQVSEQYCWFVVGNSSWREW
jgi:hypothetical protein